VVVDPFAGSGTTLLEASAAGVSSVFIASVKLGATMSRARRFEAFVQSMLDWTKRHERPDYGLYASNDLATRKYKAPKVLLAEPLAIVESWFRRYVIEDLGKIRDYIERVSPDGPTRDVALLAFAAILRNCSIADPVPVSGLEYTKRMRELDDAGRVVNAFALFRKAALRTSQSYLEYATLADRGTSRVVRTDCTRSWPLQRGTLVLTSPPYLNAVEYSRRHKLEYLWLGLVTSGAVLRTLPANYIGHRAWGKDRLEDVSMDDRFLDRLRLDLRSIDYRRARAYIRYCAQMRMVFSRARCVLPRRGRFVAVIGRSRVRDYVVPTDEVIVRLASQFDLEERHTYTLKNRYMSYSRHNGADISEEHILVFRAR
jgi:hypothetical protein